jgi:hypothetical protein
MQQGMSFSSRFLTGTAPTLIASLTLMFLSLICGWAQSISPAIQPIRLGRGWSGSFEGVWPASDSGELRQLYSSEQYETLGNTTLASTLDSVSRSAKAIYIEMASYIPEASWGRLSVGAQLVAEGEDDTPVDSSDRYDYALQKLMNGGGNIAIGIERPVYYTQTWEGGYLLINPRGTLYFDVPALNQTIYNPGMGFQLNLDVNWRAVSVGTETQMGNVVRLGAGGHLLYSAFNAKYSNKNQFDDLDNTLVMSGGVYAGVLFLDLWIVGNWSNRAALLEGRELGIRFSVTPVRF